MTLHSIAAIFLVACGATSQQPSTQAANVPEASPAVVPVQEPPPEDVSTEDAVAEDVAEAPTEDALTTCRVLQLSEGDAVDLGSVPSVRTRSRRVGPRGGIAGFSVDGSHLVYQQQGPTARSAVRVCGVTTLGGALVALDVRSRRCRVVTATEPADGASIIPLMRIDRPSDEVTRFPVSSTAGVVLMSRRDARDMQTIHGLGLRNARAIRVDSSLLLVVDEDLRVRMIDGTDPPRLLLPADVHAAAGPLLLSAPRRLAVLGRDQKLYVTDLSSETPACVMVDEPVGMYSDVTRSARFLVFARASSGPRDYEIILADLERGVARPIGLAAGVSMLTVHAVGNEERFVMYVRGSQTSTIFEIDATSGAIRRLGDELIGVGGITLSPDGRFMAYSTGSSLPGRPPRPESPSRMETQLPRLGCDPMPQMPGGCGWTANGCGDFDYLGDCPGLIREREQALRDSGLMLVRVPRAR